MGYATIKEKTVERVRLIQLFTLSIVLFLNCKKYWIGR